MLVKQRNVRHHRRIDDEEPAAGDRHALSSSCLTNALDIDWSHHC
jgi:hypothetical protein